MGSKSIKKIIGAAAPLAALIPGIGLPLATAIGAGGGLLSGGGLKGALAGGLGAAALGGGGSLLGGALGASGATANALGTGLLGAGAGGLTGGVKGAALGGVAGGLGGYAAGGGFDGLGESLGFTGEGGLFSGLSDVGKSIGLTGPGSLLGESAIASAQLPWQSPTGMPWGGGAQLPWQQASQGSGVLGAVSGALPSSGTLTGVGNSGAGMSSYGGVNAIGSLLSGLSSTNANDDAEKALLAAQGRSLGAIQPYLNAKFEPGDLTQDPGYQFRLQQGQEAMDRSLGARGSLFSGAALKASQDYGQGLADSTYNDAYQRFLAQNQQNLGAAGMAAGIYNEGGNAQANASVANSNVLNRTISGLFGNGAFGNQGQSFGGTGGLSPELLALLARNQSASSFG